MSKKTLLEVGQTVWLEDNIFTYRSVTKDDLKELDAKECLVVKSNKTSAYIQPINSDYDYRVSQKTHCCNQYMNTSRVWTSYEDFLTNKKRRLRAIDIREESKRVFDSLNLKQLEKFLSEFK